MVRQPDALFAAAAGMEAAAVWMALHEDLSAVAAILHTCAAIALAHGPGRRLVEGREGWSLAFVLALLIPVWGALGVWLASKLSLTTRRQPGRHLLRTRIPGLDELATAAFHDAGSSTRVPTYHDSVGTLRRALKDPDEDVRLVAHTILESKSRAAYRAVHEADCALREASEGASAEQRMRIAGRHFELVRLGLAEGDCRTAALHEAHTHVRAALEHTPRNRSAHFLLARIELQRRDGEAAEAALARAVELGLPDPIARPYLAEAAFLRGRLDLVASHLARIPRHSNVVVERMRRYWA